MNRWYLIVLSAYAALFAQALRDARKLWRQARLLRVVMNGKR
jgi:hypothetical protein